MKNFKRCNTMLHGVNKQTISPGELGEVVSLNLGDIPENVIDEKVGPLVEQLSDILSEYKVYVWLSKGYIENNTDNEV